MSFLWAGRMCSARAYPKRKRKVMRTSVTCRDVLKMRLNSPTIPRLKTRKQEMNTNPFINVIHARNATVNVLVCALRCPH